ncbi:hypothetical protein BV20DRAFT_772853 [Pilatotrama ljubarskyi]|nr:hypothetical protein BV20DRAFT_772853 [Pilatotrama ljubarskyi]
MGRQTAQDGAGPAASCVRRDAVSRDLGGVEHCCAHVQLRVADGIDPVDRSARSRWPATPCSNPRNRSRKHLRQLASDRTPAIKIETLRHSDRAAPFVLPLPAGNAILERSQPTQYHYRFSRVLANPSIHPQPMKTYFMRTTIGHPVHHSDVPAWSPEPGLQPAVRRVWTVLPVKELRLICEYMETSGVARTAYADELMKHTVQAHQHKYLFSIFGATLRKLVVYAAYMPTLRKLVFPRMLIFSSPVGRTETQSVRLIMHNITDTPSSWAFSDEYHLPNLVTIVLHQWYPTGKSPWVHPYDFENRSPTQLQVLQAVLRFLRIAKASQVRNIHLLVNATTTLRRAFTEDQIRDSVRSIYQPFPERIQILSEHEQSATETRTVDKRDVPGSLHALTRLSCLVYWETHVVGGALPVVEHFRHTKMPPLLPATWRSSRCPGVMVCDTRFMVVERSRRCSPASFCAWVVEEGKRRAQAYPLANLPLPPIWDASGLAAAEALGLLDP